MINKQSKFKVGQKVKVVESGEGFHPDEIGEEVTITEVGFDHYLEEQYCYRIKEIKGNNKYNDGYGWHGEGSFAEIKQEKVKQDVKQKEFKIGDKVKILRTNTAFLRETIGRVGVIKFIAQDGGLLVDFGKVSISGDSRWWYNVKDVEKISSSSMSNKQKREILQTTKGKFFSVEFTKKDGSLRKMNCRLGVAKDLKGGTNSCSNHDEYVTVYDMVAKGYRNINLETLKVVRMAGATITFE